MQHYLLRLQNAVRNYWDTTAVKNFHGEKFTYEELAIQMEKFHVFFEAAGVKKGDKIAICAKNSARWAVCFLSSNTYEAVTVPILADFHPSNVNSLVSHSESVVLFTDGDIWKKLDIEKMPDVKAVIDVQTFDLLYAADDKVQEAFKSIDKNFAEKYPNGLKPSDFVIPQDNDKELALINYTSGTSSSPKGVMLRYECLSAAIDYGQRHMPSSNDCTMVSMLPMAHMYGLVYELLYPISMGTCIVYFGRTPSPTALLKAMKEERPYLIITVPLVMEKVFKNAILPVLNKPTVKVLTHIPGIRQIIFRKIRKGLEGAFGGRVREFVMGGAALNPEVEKWFRKIKLPYTIGYGMTEAAPLLAYEHNEVFAPGSCGKAIDCVDIRIDSEDPHSVVGEIQAKGVNIMSGYYKNPEQTKLAFTEDGYMRTGDLGIIDKEGNIFIRGRSKNMIVTSNGQNIYPEEVEAVINNQEFVQESILVSRGAKLVALVVLDKEAIKKSGMDEEEISEIPVTIRKNSNKLLDAYSKITKVEIQDEPFAKTPKMSIKRYLYK